MDVGEEKDQSAKATHGRDDGATISYEKAA